MTASLQGQLVLRHLERFLGAPKIRWLSSGDDTSAFQVLQFSERPTPESQCLVTFGLSAYQLHVINKSHATTRSEFVICADSSFETKALAALLIAIGLDAVARNATAEVHDVLAGSGAVWSNPVFEHFYLTFPGYFPEDFELCEAVSPPVSFVQLVPVSSRERRAIFRQGWRAFENSIVNQKIDLLAFDTRREVAL